MVPKAALPSQTAGTVAVGAAEKAPPGEDLDPASPSRCSPAHCRWIWTLAYSEVVSSGHGAGRRGALLRCTMSRSA